MNCHIVTEGPTDEVVLRAILRPHIPDDRYAIMAAGGLSPALALARTLLLKGAARVAAVVDSDSLDQVEIERRRRIADKVLAPYASPERFKVFWAVPCIEVWLFASDSLAAVLFGKPISPAWQVQLRRHPKEMLARAMGITKPNLNAQTLQNYLSRFDLSELGQRPPVAALIDFVRQAALATSA